MWRRKGSLRLEPAFTATMHFVYIDLGKMRLRDKKTVKTDSVFVRESVSPMTK